MRILLVEDERGLAEALSALLAKEKYIVDAVGNGDDGLDYALSDVYDVIILDIMLPGKDGLEILKTLREEKIQTPVLLLTAKAQLGDKIRGLDSGADDYLTKPFQTGELLARIRAMTRRKGEIRNDDIEFGDMTLHRKTNELSCGENTVKLGLKEYQLLELLMMNPRQLITKEQFIEKIWGFDSDVEYNNVEVYISFIRKKISFVGSSVKVKATRGVGYCLEE